MSTSTAEREQQLNAILVPLVQALEKGQSLDRQQLLRAHPEFAVELQEFLAGRDCLRRFRGQEPPRSRPTLRGGDLGSIGDFQLLREIGRGGMGIVYEARQVSLDRRVALKVLPAAVALDKRQLQRFHNEAHAAALLSHAHIVPIYAVGCEGDTHYYAMQFIEGPSLAAMIQGLRQPPAGPPATVPTVNQHPRVAQPTPTHRLPIPLPVSPQGPVANASNTLAPSAVGTARSAWKAHYFRRVAELGTRAAEALEHAHQLGVVHRDIKPANLLLDARGHLWVTDFGVALLKSHDGLTSTGELVGTLRYMSPEQAAGKRGVVDHRTDIYSLGATLYELMALQPAFPGDDPREVLCQIALEEPLPPRSVDRAIPAELELIVLKAMAKSPADRYSTVQELADDLQRFLEDKPIHARRPTLLDRGLKWSRRHKGAVASAVTLLLLGMVGLMISNVLIARSNSEVTAAYQRESEKAEEVRRQWTRAENNLTQALQVVDFLTRISAEELGDRPELLQVRQRMLAGALQYYQRFIEQHQGDEAARAELDASRKRVTQILSALSAQQEYVHLMLRAMLLEEPDVRHDLGIGWDPDGKFKKLFERVQDQRHEVFRLSLTLSEQERGKKFKEMAEANEQAMAAILTSDQARRLKQIALQMRSPQVFAEPALADALRITADQKTRIRVLLDEAQRTQRDVFRPGMHPPEIHHEIHKIGKKTEQAVLALLTTPQKTAWREMTGETFYGRLHFALEAGFGPPGLGPRPEPPPEPGWGREDGFPPKGKKPPPKGPKKF